MGFGSLIMRHRTLWVPPAPPRAHWAEQMSPGHPISLTPPKQQSLQPPDN